MPKITLDASVTIIPPNTLMCRLATTAIPQTRPGCSYSPPHDA